MRVGPDARATDTPAEEEPGPCVPCLVMTLVLLGLVLVGGLWLVGLLP